MRYAASCSTCHESSLLCKLVGSCDTTDLDSELVCSAMIVVPHSFQLLHQTEGLSTAGHMVADFVHTLEGLLLMQCQGDQSGWCRLSADASGVLACVQCPEQRPDPMAPPKHCLYRTQTGL